MNELLLSRRLGIASPQGFQRAQYERLFHAVTPDESVRFGKQSSHGDPYPPGGVGLSTSRRKDLTIGNATQQTSLAHVGGVAVLAVDQQAGRYLVSGGADSAIRVWDLEEGVSNGSYHFEPVASTTSSRSDAHTHALTSLSIYPFDQSPSTVLTTSYDTTLKLFALNAASITVVHSFDLTDTPYTHSLSPLASSAGLVAVGTAHPAIKLLDLRTGLATHTLPGHSGAVFSVCWSPLSEHILASGSVDGRALFFDVRRAHSALASLDYDDALGVLSDDVVASDHYTPRAALDWSAKAHDGPVSGVRWFGDGRKLVTCGHDQRIRVWDAGTGRNDLVHFGPRIKNQRNGEFNPLITPAACGRPGREMVFWPNDDGKGEILVMDLNDGTTLGVLRTPRTQSTKNKAIRTPATRLTSGGRINSMAWRVKAQAGSALEAYSGHGDGSIHRWTGRPPEDEDGESDDDDHDHDHDQSQQWPRTDDEQVRNKEQEARQSRQKRKRDMLEGLVDGLVASSVVPV